MAGCIGVVFLLVILFYYHWGLYVLIENQIMGFKDGIEAIRVIWTDGVPVEHFPKLMWLAGVWLVLTTLSYIWDGLLFIFRGLMMLFYFLFYANVTLLFAIGLLNAWADREWISWGTAVASAVLIAVIARYAIMIIYRQYPYRELHNKLTKKDIHPADQGNEGLFEGFASLQRRRKWRADEDTIGFRVDNEKQTLQAVYLKSKRVNWHAWGLTAATLAAIVASWLPMYNWSKDELLPGGIGAGTYAGRQLEREGEEGYEWEARDVRVGVDASRQEMRVLLWSVRDGEGREVQIKVNGETVGQVMLKERPQAVTVSVPAAVEIVGLPKAVEQDLVQEDGPEGAQGVEGVQEATEVQSAQEAQETAGESQQSQQGSDAVGAAKSGPNEAEGSEPDETDRAVAYGVKFAGALRNEAYFNQTSVEVANVYTIGLE